MWQLRKLQLNARLRQPNARCLAQGNSPKRVAVLPSVEVGFTPKSLHQSAQLRKSKSRSQPTAEMSAKLLTADRSNSRSLGLRVCGPTRATTPDVDGYAKHGAPCNALTHSSLGHIDHGASHWNKHPDWANPYQVERYGLNE